MPILAINTASSITAIALLDKDKNILGQETWQSQKNEAEMLLPEIDEMLKKNMLDFDDLDSVLVVSGPGSFTGLRVGVTVANTIAYLNKANLYAVNTFEYWWNQLHHKNLQDIKYTALLIFAGSRGVYVSLSPDQTDEKTVSLINIDELENFLKEHSIIKIFGDITEYQKEQLSAEFFETEYSFSENCAKILATNLTATPIVKPLYVKAPDITLSKKTLF